MLKKIFWFVAIAWCALSIFLAIDSIIPFMSMFFRCLFGGVTAVFIVFLLCIEMDRFKP